MEHNKDIGKFIENQMAGANKTPDQGLWAKIDATLEKRKKRRGFLYFFSGLAGFILLISLITFSFNNEESITDVDGTTVSSETTSEELTNTSAEISSEEDELQNSAISNESNQNKTNQNSSLISSEENTSEENNKIITQNSIENSEQLSETNNQNNPYNTQTSTTQESQNIQNKNNKNSIVAAKNQSSYSVDATSYRKPDPISQKSGLVVGSETVNNNLSTAQKTGSTSATTSYYYYDRSTNTQVQSTRKSFIDSLRAVNEHLANLERKELVAQPTTVLVKDSKDDLKKEGKPQLVLANTADKDSVAGVRNTQFSVTGHIMPVYFVPSQTESTLDRSLELKDKSGEWTLGFGFMANYRFSENAQLSLGAYYTKLSHTTNNIFVESQRQRDTLLNLLGSDNRPDLDIQQVNSFFQGDMLGKLRQDVSYFEIPLQFSYVIPKRKFEFSMMGGFSTYFLLDDKLTFINENDQSLLLGKANNLSTVSLSLNAGLGFNHKLTEVLSIDFQPVFKWRIKALNESSYNGQTVSFGFQTGLRYWF